MPRKKHDLNELLESANQQQRRGTAVERLCRERDDIAELFETVNEWYLQGKIRNMTGLIRTINEKYGISLSKQALRTHFDKLELKRAKEESGQGKGKGGGRGKPTTRRSGSR